MFSLRLGQKLNILRCFKTFTFRFDQSRFLLVWVCVPLTYVWEHVVHLLGTPR